MTVPKTARVNVRFTAAEYEALLLGVDLSVWRNLSEFVRVAVAEKLERMGQAASPEVYRTRQAA